MKIAFGSLILNVDFDEIDSEFPGDSMVLISRKQLAEIYKAGEFAYEGGEQSDLVFDPENDTDETIGISHADDFICAMASANEYLPVATVINLQYQGSSLYWLFHDLTHAQYDAGSGDSIYVDQDVEDRALFEGGKLAAIHGVEIAEIVREIVRTETQFRERWNTESKALERFLRICKLDETKVV